MQETGTPNDSENNCSKEQMLPRNFESSRRGLSLILDNRFSLVYLGFLWILGFLEVVFFTLCYKDIAIIVKKKGSPENFVP